MAAREILDSKNNEETNLFTEFRKEYIRAFSKEYSSFVEMHNGDKEFKKLKTPQEKANALEVAFLEQEKEKAEFQYNCEIVKAIDSGKAMQFSDVFKQQFDEYLKKHPTEQHSEAKFYLSLHFGKSGKDISKETSNFYDLVFETYNNTSKRLDVDDLTNDNKEFERFAQNAETEDIHLAKCEFYVLQNFVKPFAEHYEQEYEEYKQALQAQTNSYWKNASEWELQKEFYKEMNAQETVINRSASQPEPVNEQPSPVKPVEAEKPKQTTPPADVPQTPVSETETASGAEVVIPDLKYSRTRGTQALNRDNITFGGQTISGLSQNIVFKSGKESEQEKSQVLSVLDSVDAEGNPSNLLLAVTRTGDEKPLAVFEKSSDGKIALRLEKNFAKSFAGVNIAKDEAEEYFSYDMSKVAFSQTKGIETAQVSGAGDIAIAISAIGAIVKDVNKQVSKQASSNPFNIALSKNFIEMSLSKDENGCMMEKEEPLFSAVMVSAIQLERQNQNAKTVNIEGKDTLEEVVSLEFGDIKLHSVPVKSPDGTIQYLNIKEENGKASAYVQLTNPTNSRSKTQAKFEPINSIRLASGEKNGQTVQSLVIEFGSGNGVTAKRTAYIDANFEENHKFINLMNEGNLLSAAANKAEETLGAARSSTDKTFGKHTIYDFDGQTSTTTADLDKVGVLSLTETEKPVEPIKSTEPKDVPPVPNDDDGSNLVESPLPPEPQQPNDPIPEVPREPVEPEGPSQPVTPPIQPPAEEPKPENPKGKEEEKEGKDPFKIVPKDEGLSKTLIAIFALCVALSVLMPLPFAIFAVIMGGVAAGYQSEFTNEIKEYLNKKAKKKRKEKSKEKKLAKQKVAVKKNKTAKAKASLKNQLAEINHEIGKQEKAIAAKVAKDTTEDEAERKALEEKQKRVENLKEFNSLAEDLLQTGKFDSKEFLSANSFDKFDESVLTAEEREKLHRLKKLKGELSIISQGASLSDVAAYSNSAQIEAERDYQKSLSEAEENALQRVIEMEEMKNQLEELKTTEARIRERLSPEVDKNGMSNFSLDSRPVAPAPAEFEGSNSTNEHNASTSINSNNDRTI